MTSTLTRPDQAEQVTIIVREYLRVSRDQSGRERSQEEQHEENAQAAEAEGWTLGEPYQDTGSASEYTQKTRAAFQALIEDLEADRFGAQRLMIWEASRLSRDVAEWLQVIVLCIQRGVQIHITHNGGRTYNPAMYAHKGALIDLANKAAMESGGTSGRVGRARKAEKERGVIHGVAPFGYQRDYVRPETGNRKVLKVVQLADPEQAPVVRELFDRFLSGQSLRSIRLDFASRGITSNGGKTFADSGLRAMLMRPTYAGLRSANPKIVGEWEGLVSVADFYRVQVMLAASLADGVRPRRGARNVRLCSTIVRCGVCEGPLSSKPRRGRDMYSCQYGSHVAVAQDELDIYVEEVALTYLASDEVAERITAAPAEDGELSRALAEITRLDAQQVELVGMLERDDISLEMAGAKEKSIARNRAKVVEQVTALTVPDPLRPLFEGSSRDGGSIREVLESNWNALDNESRRMALRVLLTPKWLGRLVVVPSPTPRRACDIELRVSWRESEAA